MSSVSALALLKTPQLCIRVCGFTLHTSEDGLQRGDLFSSCLSRRASVLLRLRLLWKLAGCWAQNVLGSLRVYVLTLHLQLGRLGGNWRLYSMSVSNACRYRDMA